MPDDVTVSELTQTAMERSDRNIGILTSFFQEASVLVFVFGILDTYASNKLTLGVGIVVAVLGFILLIAAFTVKFIYRQVLRSAVKHWLSSQEQSATGDAK